MGKIIHQYNGILMDSQEEVWMAMWLEELKNIGYVEKWHKVTTPIKIIDEVKFNYVKVTELKTKTKREVKHYTFLNDLEYTPDFQVHWTDKGIQKFVSHIGYDLDMDMWFFCDMRFNISLIEVKPIFDQHDKTAKFSLIQKIIWRLHKVYVNLVLPEKLFEGTFMPKDAMDDFKYKKSPTGKNKGKKKVGDWKTDYTPKTLKEYLNDE